MADAELLDRAEEQLRCLRIPDALRLFHLAEQAGCDPDECAAGRWRCHMLVGDFERAWQESDSINARGNPDPHRYWDGATFQGRSVLIRCLHGLGDTIQFIRYAPLVRREARALTIEAQPTLKSLLQQSDLADTVITWGEAEPRWDQQMEAVELPRIFRTTLDSIPTNVPYLDVPSVLPVALYNGMRPLRVGFVWASSTYNTARSIPLKEIASLFGVAGVSFFSLQASPERSELEHCYKDIPNLYDESGCVLTLARNLKNLDLVITVDTMVAHLAGAMARPVWTLLPYECDWRWMLDRDDSPWYPTMRLFRQTRPGDWTSVIRHLRQDLERFAAATEVPLAISQNDDLLSHSAERNH